jgi:hypothetical protein
MYDKFIDKFMPSKDMREYLKTFIEIPFCHIKNIIYHSDKSIQVKLEALKELEKEIPAEDQDDYDIQAMHESIASIEYALEILKNDVGVYTLEIGYYDTKINDSDSKFESLYSTFEEALVDANETVKYYKEDYDDMAWTVITKWEKDENGKMVNRCEYFILDSEIKYINLHNPAIEDYCWDMLVMGGDLYLPVPFERGDIVEIDRRPFGLPFHALVVTVGDNRDCCSFQALAKNEEGKWNIGAVKHSSIGPNLCPSNDMLYSMVRYNGDLTEDEKLLQKVSDAIKDSDDKAEELMYQLPSYCTNSELEETIKSLGKMRFDKTKHWRTTANLHTPNCDCWICKTYPGKYNK